MESGPLEIYIEGLLTEKISQLEERLLDRMNKLISSSTPVEEPVAEYMPAVYFLKKYKDFFKSKVTFYRIKNSGHVHSYRKLGTTIYSVEQFNKAFENYRPKKIFFYKKALRKQA